MRILKLTDFKLKKQIKKAWLFQTIYTVFLIIALIGYICVRNKPMTELTLLFLLIFLILFIIDASNQENADKIRLEIRELKKLIEAKR